MAEQALVAHAPQHSLVIAAIESRGHAPLPGLRVPGDGKLIELAAWCLVQIGAGVVAGAEDPVDRLLESVDPFSAGIDRQRRRSAAHRASAMFHDVAGALMPERRSVEVSMDFAGFGRSKDLAIPTCW